jgi:putative flavoprotein involved in K+ transport
VDKHKVGTAAARREPNHYVTGRDGGHDIDLRAHALSGMNLHGRLTHIAHGRLHFDGDLRERLEAADAVAERIKDTIDAWIADNGIEAPTEDRYQPVWEPPAAADSPTELDLHDAGIRSVVWATGFRSDWSWVDIPGFLREGYPRYERGICDVNGLYVLGLPWLWTWGSGRFAGVARDAHHVTERIAARARVPAAG